MDAKIIILFLLFASVIFGIYFIVPKKHRYLVILISSLLFYIIYSKFMVAFILTTIISIYFAGIIFNSYDKKFEKQKENLEKEERKKLKSKFKRKKKLIIAFFIIFNLLILGILKYSGFFASVFDGFFQSFNITTHFPVLKLALPLGISYYTLSSIGYMIDVYRGKYKGEENFFKVALFVLYFPQLLEGPFATYDKLAPQLYAGQDFDKRRFFSGLLLVAWGFFKKIVIADRLAIIAGEIFANYSQYSGLFIIIGILAFTFQLYAEFSGIINIVSGISEMYGFKLAKNFEQPFFSKNVNEFWRRWHISLGAWFREYVFYPISMSKGMLAITKKLHGKVTPLLETLIPSSIALFAVWFCTGLWHGASVKYIVYGLYYYIIMMVGMCFEPLFKKLFAKMNITSGTNKEKILNILRIVRTFILVNIGMLIFRAENLNIAFDMFTSVFQPGQMSIPIKVIDIYDTIMCVIGVITLIISDIICEKKIDLREIILNKNILIKFLIILALIFIILIFGAYGEGYIPVDPIYGGF